MKLLHLNIRFRMSKDSAPSFPQLKARKLSREFKVSKYIFSVAHKITAKFFKIMPK